MAKNRSHSSIARKLSAADKEELNKRLATPGVTYDDMVEWLKGKGYAISRSAVGRYGKGFLSRLESLKVVEEKAMAIVSEVGDALSMEEAAAKIFTQKVLEHLLQIDDLTGQKFGGLMTAFAKLQASSTQRERLKGEFRKKTEAVLAEAGDRKEMTREEMLQWIKERVYGL